MSSVPIETLKDDWALILMQKGIIVKLNVSRWRATCAIKYEDLGLTFCDEETLGFMRKYVTLGSEKLFPPEVLSELNNFETRAKENLNNYSFETLWGRFVPFTAFEEWSKQNEIYKIQYLEAAKRLHERYDEIVTTVKENYKKMAKDVWKRIYPNDNKEPSASFVENFTSKITSRIPSSEFIVASFKYESTYFSIPLPSFLEEDLRKTQKIQQQREIDALKVTEEKRIIALISAEYQTKKREMIDSFLDSTVQALRNSVAELFENVLTGLRKNENTDLRKPQIDKIKKVIEHVHLLNFQNDKEVENLLIELNSEVNKFKGDRDRSTILKHLQSIVDLSKKEFIPNDINPITELEL